LLFISRQTDQTEKEAGSCKTAEQAKGRVTASTAGGESAAAAAAESLKRQQSAVRTLSNASSNRKSKSKARQGKASIEPLVPITTTSATKSKPKISSQSSVNDDLETASTTTESSSASPDGDLSDAGASSSGHRSSSSSGNSSGNNTRRRNVNSKPGLDLGLLTSTLIAAASSAPGVAAAAASPGDTAEPSGRKKKSKKVKSEEQNNMPKESVVNGIIRQQQAAKLKKPLEKTEDSVGRMPSVAAVDSSGKQQHDKKIKSGPTKAAADCGAEEGKSGVRSPANSLTPAATPPPILKRQEAKVKGIPKEVAVLPPSMAAKAAGIDVAGGELRRSGPLQQQFGHQPAYESKPPRLQHPSLGRQDSYSGAGSGYGSSSSSSQLLGDSYLPMLSTLQPAAVKPDPPRAIIMPELKAAQQQQQPPPSRPDHGTPLQPNNNSSGLLGNQFGAIGCKVPVSPPPALNSGWTDAPLLSASLLRQHSSPSSVNSLLAAPATGLTIMQQLQAERRQREEEFRRNSQWPGFGPEPEPLMAAAPAAPPSAGLIGPNYIESLWDPPVAASPQVARRPPEGLWGTIGRNVWPSSLLQAANSHSSAYNESQQQHQLLQHQYLQQQQQQDHVRLEEEGSSSSSLLRFDSLALSSIWGAGGGGSSSAEQQQQAEAVEQPASTWSSTLFTNKDL
jgi:hypothetical protein